MEIASIIYFFILFIGAVMAAILASYCTRFWHIPAGRSLYGVISAQAFVLIVFLLLSTSDSPEQAFFWARFRFLGLAIIPPMMLLFALFYTGKQIKLMRLLIVVIFIVPTLTQVVIWSDQAIPLFFREWSLIPVGVLFSLQTKFGFLYQIYAFYSVILITVTVGLLVVYLRNEASTEHAPTIVLLAGILLFSGFTLIPSTLGNILSLNPTPIGIMINVIFEGIAILFYHLFDLVPSAYHTIFSSLRDAVIVVDTRNVIIRINDAAKMLLTEKRQPIIGQPLLAIFEKNGYQGILTDSSDAQIKVAIRKRVFDTRISTLKMTNDVVIGKVVVLRDITRLEATEAALRQSEELYRLLADNITDMVSLRGLDGRFLYVSPSFIRYTGYSSEELINVDPDALPQLIYADDIQLVYKSTHQQNADKGALNRLEYRLMRKDGTPIWVESYSTPIYDQENELIQRLVTTRVITERKRIEDALRTSNQRYDTLVENIPAVIYQFRRTPQGEYRFDYISPMVRKYNGLEPEAIIENPELLSEQRHPDDRASQMAFQEESARNLTPFKWEGRGFALGKPYWVRLESMPTRLEDGTVIWNGVRIDITAQKEAEIALERSRKLVEHITHLLPDLIHVVDITERKSIYSNRKFEQLLGVTEDNVANIITNDRLDYLRQLMHPDDYATELSFGNRYATIQDDEIVETEYRWKHKTKGYVWLNVREVVYERAADGTVKQILGVIRDVSDRKTADEQRQQLVMQLEAANQELKDFAYVISHDLKAPLRGVSSIASWLVSGYSDQFDAHGQELLVLLGGRVRRMEQMINGVLEYSRIGHETTLRGAVDLHIVVTQIVQDIVPADRIKVVIENRLPVLNIEPMRIRQVFQNLIDNAVKYMDKPEGEIRIGCEQKSSYWYFWVKDNGPGIASEHFERIFQMFQTLVSRDQFESTGIGLTMIKKIVEVYDGKIWVESILKQGTTFYFTLPRNLER
jgi:PAS domain S-box-containing protein